MSEPASLPGWFPDPLERYPWRYWTGTAWSRWVSNGFTALEDSVPVSSKEDELAHIAYAEAFVEDMARRNLIRQRERRSALEVLHHRRQTVSVRGPLPRSVPVPASRPAAVGPEVSAPTPVVRQPIQRIPAPPAPVTMGGRTAPPEIGPQPVPPPKLPEPLEIYPHRGDEQFWPRRSTAIPAVARAWTRLRKAVMSDLAVYGLAYLGVLLLFTGVFGLVAFSMPEVRKDLRPVAEVAIPVATFASAWLLGRRGRTLVPKTLIFLTGLLLPVVALASFVDGSPYPPDPKGGVLVAVLAAVSLALAAIYALVARYRRDSPIRFLVAPAVWLTVAMAGLAAHPSIPHGEAITRPVPWQMALLAGVIAVSVLVSRRLSNHWRSAVEWPAIPAAALTLMLTALAASAHGWPAPPLVVAGAASLVTLELLARWFRPELVAIGQATLAVAVLASCVPHWSLSWVGAAGVVSFLVLTEWEGRRRPGPVATVATLGGAAGWLVVASSRPWPAVTAYAAASAWVQFRRYRRAPWLPSGPWLTAAGAVLPAGVAGGLMAALPPGQASVGIACGVAAIAIGISLSGLDGFWRWWIPAAATTSIALGLAASSSAADLAIVTGVSAVAFAAAPAWSWLRTWATAASALASLAFAMETFAVAPPSRVVVFAAAGLSLVAAAVLPLLARSGHIGLIGHTIAAGALAATAAPSLREAFFPALAAFSAGWTVTTIADETKGAPVVKLAASTVSKVTDTQWLAASVALFPRLMAILSLPVLAVTGADRWGLIPARHPQSALIVAGFAFVYAAAGRWLLADHLVGAVLAPAGFGFALLSVLASRSEAVAAIAIGVAITTIAVIEPSRRLAPYKWCAWALTAPLVVLVSRLAGFVGTEWYPALIVWGGVLTVTMLAWDDLRNGRRSAGEWVRTGWMKAPTLLAAAGLMLGTAAEFTTTPAAYGWWSLSVGAVTALIAWQLRVGGLSFVSWSLFSIAYVVLAPWNPVARPWSLALFGIALAGFAVPLQRLEDTARSPWWQRWDVPTLSVGFGVTLFALGCTSTYGSVAATFSAAGGLATAMWVWRRSLPWLYLADALFLISAADAGRGWAALALMAVSVETTFLAIRTEPPARTGLQVASVAAFATGAVQLGVWLGVSPDQAVISAALAGGLVIASTGFSLRRSPLALQWAGPWASIASLALAGAAVALFTGSVNRGWPGAAVAGGFGLAAIGLGLAAEPLILPPLRETAAVALAVGGGALLYSTSPDPWILVAATVAAGLTAAVAASFAHYRHEGWSWTRPIVIFSALSTSGAVGIVAYADPGPGSASLLLMAISAECMLAAVAARGTIRWAMQATGAAVLGGAAVEFGLWRELSADQAVMAASLTGGTVALMLAASCRWWHLRSDWLVSFGAAALLALSAAACALFTGAVSHQRPGFAVSGGLALATVAAALAAEAVAQRWLREAGAVLAAASGAGLLYALQPSPATLVASTTATGLTVTLSTAAIERFRPASNWIRPLAIFGAAATAGALGVAVYALPRRDLLALALLATGAEAAVVGFAFKRLGPLVLSPVILCASWLVFATESLSSNPEWYTIPIGVTLIAIDELERDHARRLGQHPTTPVIALEYIAMAFIVGSALAQQIVASLAYSILSLGLGLALGIWGITTHVRRRLFFGAGVTVTSILLLIAVPSAANAPGWHGPSLWIAVATLGLVAMAIAAGIEQGHDRLHHLRIHLSHMFHNWE